MALEQINQTLLPKESRRAHSAYISEPDGTQGREITLIDESGTYAEQCVPDVQRRGMLKEWLRARHQVYRSSRSPLQVFLEWWYRR